VVNGDGSSTGHRIKRGGGALVAKMNVGGMKRPLTPFIVPGRWWRGGEAVAGGSVVRLEDPDHYREEKQWGERCFISGQC
jgi:hypothetical protein